MHEFSNVPNKALDFYKQKDESEVEKQPVKDKKDKKDKPRDSKEGKNNKKNQAQKFLEEHVAIGPTETVVHIQENIKKFTDTWGSRDETEVSEEIYDTQLAKDQLRPNIEE